jgi:tetratricopeptide (TPR) repeat protein
MASPNLKASGKREDAPVVKDAAYYAQVRKAIGRGAPTLLLGTSRRSLKRSLDKLRAAQPGVPAVIKNLEGKSGPTAQGSITQLLRPEAEVVPFMPRAELAYLMKWAGENGGISAQLIIGPAGSGKTRLVQQLAAQLSMQGWQSLWISRGGEHEAAKIVQASDRPSLLVVDYAETLTDLAALFTVMTDTFSGPGIRLVLLARSAGEWWNQLIETSLYQLSKFFGDIEPIALGALPRGWQHLAFENALTAFAAAFSIQPPNAELFLTTPDPVILSVHAAALRAVLDRVVSTQSVTDSVVPLDTFAQLLQHEARYWRQSQAARGLDLDAAVARQAVALAYLVGADDEPSAISLLRAVPGLAGSEEQRASAARWLHDLYPVSQHTGSEQEWIGWLTPDFIAETLLAMVINEWPDLIPASFTGLSERRASRALTVLARVSLTYPVARDQLQLILESDLENQIVPALAVTVATNSALAELIRDTLASSTLPYSALARIATAIPYPSVTLAEIAAVVFERLSEVSVDDVSQHAQWLVDLSAWLSLLGRRERALGAGEEAVAIHRALAEARPDAFRPDLAASLSNLGIMLSELGRLAEALPVTEEAVTIHRELTAAAPDRYRPDLATSLSNLGVSFSELGRPAEALPVTEEAVTIRRELTAAAPDRYRPELATSLSNLGVMFSELGRPAEALPVTEEAVTIRRELAQVNPDRYLPDLAASLTNQAVGLSELGRTAEALPVTEEAVSIGRALAEARPDAFRPDLAASLSNLGIMLSELGRPAEALPVTQEAVVIRRELAQVNPDRYRPDLAASLSNLGIMLSELGRPAEALPVTEEAMAIHRELAKAMPGTLLSDLALSLTNQSNRQVTLSRRKKALAAADEMMVGRSSTLEAPPDVFLLGPEGSLNNLDEVIAAVLREADAALIEAARRRQEDRL